MHQSSASAHEVNTMEAKLAQVSVLLLGVVVAVLVGPCSSVTQEPMNNREPSSHTQTSSELLQSVMVNQMTLLRILNQSSTNCSPDELAIAVFNARQEDAKEELRRSLETALKMLKEKKEEALDEVTEKKIQSLTELASFKNSAVEEMTETKQNTNLNFKAVRGRLALNSRGTKIFRIYTESLPQKEAMRACERKGGRIAVPQNQEEESQLISLLNDHEYYDYHSFWIGGNDKENEGTWIDSNTGLPLAFKNFQDQQPDDYGTDGEDCLVLQSSWGTWNDFPCDLAAHGYFCEISDQFS